MSSPQAPTPDVEELRAKLRKQAQAHLDGTAWRTHIEATDILSLLDEIERLRERLDAVREWAASRKSEAAVVLDNPDDYHPSVVQIAAQDTSTANTIATLLAPTSDKTKGGAG